MPGLPDRAAELATETRSLFNGEAARTLREVGPSLLRMNGPGPLLDGFLSSGREPLAMWDRHPGILLATGLGLDALARHLRRFMRVEAPHGVFFFRFWDPPGAVGYFDAIAESDDRDRWFYPREGGRIDAIMVPNVRNDSLHIYRPGADPDTDPAGRAWTARPFRISRPELEAVASARVLSSLDQLVALMAATFPDLAAHLGGAELQTAVHRAVLRCAGFGIQHRENIFRFVAWDLHARGNFEDVDPGGELVHILTSNLTEAEKMARLTSRIAGLSPANR